MRTRSAAPAASPHCNAAAGKRAARRSLPNHSARRRVLVTPRRPIADVQNARMADYTPIVTEMRSRYDVRVRRWRRDMTGCAWRVCYHDGRSINWIEAPRPRTPISLSIFLHEVGHHAIGFGTYRKRCEEEYYVWLWAIREMRKLG